MPSGMLRITGGFTMSRPLFILNDAHDEIVLEMFLWGQTNNPCQSDVEMSLFLSHKRIAITIRGQHLTINGQNIPLTQNYAIMNPD